MAQLSTDDERKENLQANRLEEYLQSVFEEECKFKIEDEEVKFIQQGIESLVRSFIDYILVDDKIVAYLALMLLRLETNYPEFTFYFPSKLDELFKEYINHKPESIPLFKVGSFYEGTRNKIPDEFDFIFSLATVGDKEYNGIIMNIKLSVKDVCHNFEMSIHDGGKTISFLKFLGSHGPAFLLQFEYKNSFNHTRIINVDLAFAVQSPAAKIKMADIHKRNLSDQCALLKSYRDKVLSQENFLVIQFRLSLALVETDFIRNDLSANHRKVYRILKYLINGEVNEDDIKEALLPDATKTGYSSYHIKIMILYHHDACRNSGTNDLEPCVLQVLEDMSKYEDTGNFPMFERLRRKRFTLLPYLKTLIETLRSKQSQTGMYECETQKMKSVSSQFLDDYSRKTGETSSSDTDASNLDVKIGNSTYNVFLGGRQVWLPPK